MNDLVSMLSIVGLVAAMAVVAGAAGYWCGKIDGNMEKLATYLKDDVDE